MKKHVLLSVLIVLGISTHATVHTVSNSLANPGQYNSVTAAITAAVSGDTIYVHGTPFAYAGFAVTKPLVIIGTGHHPRKQLAYVSVGDVAIQSSNVTLDGFAANNMSVISFPFNNVTIRNCEIYWTLSIGYSSGNISNLLIENNIIWGGNFNPFAINWYGNTNYNNVMVRNNIFHNRNSDIQSPVTFDHNLFYAAGIGEAFSNVNFATITNNIFYIMSPQGAGNSTFNNNITFNTLNNTLPYGSNIGSGNLINTDPLFVNYPIAGAGFSTTHDYHLQGASPGKNAATDGTDIGPQGSVGFSMTGEPPIPVIRLMDINNPNVPAGGTLNVHLKSSKAVK